MIRDAKIICTDADPRAYHLQTSERGTPGFVMTQSALKEFSRCPSRWKNGYVSPGSESQAWGKLMDCRVLTPQRFYDVYAERPEGYPAPEHHRLVKAGEMEAGELLPWTSKATYCQDWIEEKQRMGLEVLSPEWSRDSLAASKCLMEDDVAGPFIAGSDKQVHVTAVWKDKDTGLEIPLKALLDLVGREDGEFSKAIGDMKQITNADHTPFFYAMQRYAWDVQAAFYTDMFVAATGRDICTWAFVLQENYSPWQVGKRILSVSREPTGIIECARQCYRFNLRRYAKCVAENRFPGYENPRDSVQGWTPIENTARLIEERTRSWQLDDSPTVDELREQDTANEFGDGFSVGMDTNV